MSCFLDSENITSIIQNIIVSLSIIIGGVWAYFRFRRRNEIASLSVKIEKIEILNIAKGLNFLSIEVLIKNQGDREVKLYYNYKTNNKPSKYEESNKQYQSQITLYKVAESEKLIPISNKTGLTSGMPRHTGRLRSKVEIRLPYIFPINEPGVYFLEFNIDINMQSYFKAYDHKDRSVVGWSDRIFYKISEKNLTK